RGRDTCRHTYSAADAPFGLQHRTTAVVEREGALTDRAGARAHAAFRTLECDAQLRVQLAVAHAHRLPRHAREGARLARGGARHILAGNAGTRGRIEIGRSGGQTAAVCWHLEDGVHGADVDAVAAARACRHKRHFGRSAGRAEPALWRDALLGAPRDLLEQLPDRALEECAPVVQKLGSRLTCHRNRTRWSGPSAA